MKIFSDWLALAQALAERDTVAWRDLPLSPLESSAQAAFAVILYRLGALLKRVE